jgi:TusA-related sulfurtransferase
MWGARSPSLQELIATAREGKEPEPGQVSGVLADDGGIKENTPAWCRTTGKELWGIEEEAGQYRVQVNKSRDERRKNGTQRKPD